jgi:hypothetical protein
MRIDDKDAEGSTGATGRKSLLASRDPWVTVTRDQKIIVGEVRSITPVTLPVPSST